METTLEKLHRIERSIDVVLEMYQNCKIAEEVIEDKNSLFFVSAEEIVDAITFLRDYAVITENLEDRKK